MPVELFKNNDVIEIEITGRWTEISEAKEKVKEIPGRRWDGDKKRWYVPADPHLADRLLKTLNPSCDEELMIWLKASMTSAEESLTSPLPADAKLSLPWAHQRMLWQPAVVNDETFTGLLPYQRAAVRAMADSGRALLCDDMGLGKTLEAMSAVEQWVLDNGQPDGPRLVVAPSSVLGGWRRELDRWLDEPNIQIVDSKTPAKRHDQITQGIKDDAWVVVNWEQLRIKKIEAKTRNGGRRKLTVMKEPLFQYPQAADWGISIDDWDIPAYAKASREFDKADPGWLAVIADEIHRAKSRDAQQTKGLWRTRGQVMYGLTGTPLMNSPDELWSLLRWLWPSEYHEQGEKFAPGAMAYWPFYMTYVDFWEDQRGRKVVTGVKNPDALRFALKGKLIRRTAAILNLKGRKRFYYDVPMTPTQEKMYREAETQMWLEIQRDAVAGDEAAQKLAAAALSGASATDLMRIPNGAARFVRLQQILENCAVIGGPDESGSMDDFEQKYQDSRPEPWIVFVKYKLSCELLADRLRKKFGARVAIYNGDVTSQDRTAIEDSFQRGELDVVVGTIDAMYQGITLTNGHLQAWLSRDVVPAKNEQGESRQDRLGQQKRVNVYIPQAPSTVATGTVHTLNSLKEGIVKTVIPMDEIKKEGSV